MAIASELTYPSGRPYKFYQPTGGRAPSYLSSSRVTDIPSLTTYSSYGGYTPQGDNELFGGIDRYEADRPRTTTPTARPAPSISPSSRYSSFMTPQFKKHGGAVGGTSGSRPQMPYGSMSFWQPGAGMERPAMGAFPEYMAPTIDRPRISELQELAMGAPMGRLRRGLQRSLTGSRYIENPTVRAMIEREALAGYGGGISDIRTGTGREAWQLYMPEFQEAGKKAGLEYQAGIQRVQTQFQTDLAEYLKRGRQITAPIAPGQRKTYPLPRIT